MTPGLEIHVDSRVPLGAGLSSSAALECSVAVAVCGPARRRPHSRRTTRPRPGLCPRRDRGCRCTHGRDGPDHLPARRARAPPCSSTSTAHTSDPGPAPPGRARVRPARHRHPRLALPRRGRRRRVRRTSPRLPAAAVALGVPRCATRGWPPSSSSSTTGCVGGRVTSSPRSSGWTRPWQRWSALDWPDVGRLLGQSHASMRDDFEISLPSSTWPSTPPGDAGALGARMTGGGFGGSSVALVPSTGWPRLRPPWTSRSSGPASLHRSTWWPTPSAGARSSSQPCPASWHSVVGGEGRA